MSGSGEGEFTTEGALTLSVDERSLSRARDTVEEEFAEVDVRTTADVTAVKLDREAVRSARDSLKGALDGVPVTVEAQADASGIGGDGGPPGGAASEAMGELVTQSATNIDLDETRNELLRDIEDLLEQIALNTEGGGGDDGGPFRIPRRIPRPTGRGTLSLSAFAAGAAATFGLTDPQGTPEDAPQDAPTDAPADPTREEIIDDAPSGVSDGVPIRLPDPFGEGTPGRSPAVADGTLSEGIARNRVGPNVGRQAGAGALLAAGVAAPAVGAGGAIGGIASRLGIKNIASRLGIGGAEGSTAAGGLGIGLGMPTGAGGLSDGGFGAIVDFFTEERSRASAIDAFLQSSPGLSETSISTEAGQRSLAGSPIDIGGGGGGPAASPAATLADATIVDVVSRGGEFVVTIRLDGRTVTRPLSQLPQSLRDRALRQADEGARGGGGGGGTTTPRARSGATRDRNDDVATEAATRAREEISRAVEGSPSPGPRDRPGDSNTRL